MDTESTKKSDRKIAKRKQRVNDIDRAEVRMQLDIAADVGAMPEILHDQICQETGEWYGPAQGINPW